MAEFSKLMKLPEPDLETTARAKLRVCAVEGVAVGELGCFGAASTSMTSTGANAAVHGSTSTLGAVDCTLLQMLEHSAFVCGGVS
jgi:hypothetical protein